MRIRHPRHTAHATGRKPPTTCHLACAEAGGLRFGASNSLRNNPVIGQKVSSSSDCTSRVQWPKVFLDESYRATNSDCSSHHTYRSLGLHMLAITVFVYDWWAYFTVLMLVGSWLKNPILLRSLGHAWSGCELFCMCVWQYQRPSKNYIFLAEPNQLDRDVQQAALTA